MLAVFVRSMLRLASSSGVLDDDACYLAWLHGMHHVRHLCAMVCHDAPWRARARACVCVCVLCRS